MDLPADIKDSYTDLDLIPFLYNTCYGGYGYTKEFMDRLNTLRREAAMEPYEDSYSIEMNKSLRTDPMITALFQEMGSEKASSEFSDIDIKWIPREFIKYIDLREYDGRESVWVKTPDIYRALLKDFLTEWKSNPSLTVSDLDDRTNKLDAKIERYSEFKNSEYKKTGAYLSS